MVTLISLSTESFGAIIFWFLKLLLSKFSSFFYKKKNSVFIPFCPLKDFSVWYALFFVAISSLTKFDFHVVSDKKEKNTLQMSLCFKRREYRMEGGYLVGKNVCCASMRS